MNQWPNDSANMFSQSPTGHLNPAAIFNNNQNAFDLNSHFQQGMLNGGNASPTPPFSNQNFQPGSVVPAKRPHDGMSGSPTQASRSQTPNLGGYPNQPGGGQQFPNAPTPYGHLQQPGSNNATPSPTMQNQQFRPPGQQQPQQRMQNASPSPFPGQQSGGFSGNQMAPSTPQAQTPQNNMPQGGQMGWNPAMGTSMSMPGMPSAMAAQMNNMGNQNAASVQRAYQMKLMQQQQQLARSQMMAGRGVGGQPGQINNFAMQQAQHQQSGTPAVNGQANNMMGATPQQQQQQQQLQIKRQQFLKLLQQQAQSTGRQINISPQINGRPVDLYSLWTMCVQLGGSGAVDRAGQWQMVATKLGFPQNQHPMAAEELKQVHASSLSQYERAWFTMRAQQKQEQARLNAQHMAGVGGQQGSPVRMQLPQGQQNPYQQMQQSQPQQQAQATPVQAHAQLPPNGMTTPQQQTQQMMHHRRNSSMIRKPDQASAQMTPQANPAMSAGSPPPPSQQGQQLSAVKAEPAATVMKSQEPQSSNYIPYTRHVETDGGYETPILFELGTLITRAKPNMPSVDEMGVIDTRAITLSLASGIHSEVRYALDMLAILSNDSRISFDLEKCLDLMDVIIDCAEEQTDILSQDSTEKSDGIDLLSYEAVLRAGRAEADTLQEVPEFGSSAYESERAADKVVCITTILRNFSFYECNHRLLTSPPAVQWISNTIRLLGTRNLLLRTNLNTQDFYKDVVTLLSNITQSLELPSRDDALNILHFLLAFAPQPAPSYTQSGCKIRFSSFVPTVHRYLPPAVDSLAKLLARQDPNRSFYRSIFSYSGSSSTGSGSALDLLTRAFGLAIAVLPDRSRGAVGNSAQLRIVEARKAYLSQGMLAADILANLVPGNDHEMARSWVESEDGWAVSLVNLAGLLSIDRNQPPGQSKGREIGMDTESFRLITHRALAMVKRLAEKAGKGPAAHRMINGSSNGNTVNGAAQTDEDSPRPPRWEGIPQGHVVLGSLMLPNTDKVALGLLCGLHDMAMQT